MQNDRIEICDHCGSEVCYKNRINDEITLSSCLSCGFISNTIWKSNSELFNQQMELFPELYKVITHQDINDDYWVPNLVHIHDKGMVFVDGTNEDDCEWVGVKAIKIPKSEKEKYKKVKSTQKLTHKPDMTTKKGFGKGGYLQALNYIGVTN